MAAERPLSTTQAALLGWHTSHNGDDVFGVRKGARVLQYFVRKLDKATPHDGETEDSPVAVLQRWVQHMRPLHSEATKKLCDQVLAVLDDNAIEVGVLAVDEIDYRCENCMSLDGKPNGAGPQFPCIVPLEESRVNGVAATPERPSQTVGGQCFGCFIRSRPCNTCYNLQHGVQPPLTCTVAHKTKRLAALKGARDKMKVLVKDAASASDKANFKEIDKVLQDQEQIYQAAVVKRGKAE